jgi:NAD+ synthase (glutamine-hydrolysing)
MATNGRATSHGRTLRVAGAQIRNVVGDLAGNAEQILAAMSEAEEAGADVVVFPELALTGYPLADLVLRKEFVNAAAATLDELACSSGLVASVVGTVARVPSRRSWDIHGRDVAISAAVLFDGQLRGAYHKVMLPNYEVFDEARNFAPGSRPDALWRIGEVVAGIAICEDLWSGDGPPEAQAAAGAEILLVPNASPFHQEKPAGRHAHASEVARRNATPVVYVNCVGGQDELVFDGGSLVVDANGELLHRAPQFETECFCLDVPLGPPRPVAGKPITVHARPRSPRRQMPAPASAPEMPADAQVWRCLVLGTRDFLLKNGRSSAVLGLSGGIDAAVTAAVAADALGPANVLGVAMPTPESPAEELHDAEVLAAGLGIEYHVIPLEGITSAVRDGLAELLDGTPDERPTEGLAARTRAAILWAISDQLGHLPLATGNKTELSVGTAAVHGDMAGVFAPLKDCPKTLLYRLAALRNQRGSAIPQRIIERPPTVRTDAWGELPGYAVLDQIVERYLERGESLDDLVAAGFAAPLVRRILQLVDDSEFQRRQTPPGVKITTRAFGQDLRMPITNAWRPYATDHGPPVAVPLNPVRGDPPGTE